MMPLLCLRKEKKLHLHIHELTFLNWDRRVLRGHMGLKWAAPPTEPPHSNQITLQAFGLRQLNPGGKPSTSSSKTSLQPLMVQRHSFISAQAPQACACLRRPATELSQTSISAQAPQACACLRRPATEPSQTSTFARLDDQLTSLSATNGWGPPLGLH